MKTCSFVGCGKRAICKTYCGGHYRQFKEGETLRPLQVQYRGMSEIKRFLMRVNKSSSGECWPWTGSRQEKWHGQWRNANGDIEPTHRAAWRLFVSEIPKGMFILHKCDNPICCNPSHLFLGNQSDNCKDMWQKGRARPGKSLGEKHGMSKVTAEIVRDIRSSSESGKSLADKYGISQTTVGDIRKRKSWNHLE